MVLKEEEDRNQTGQDWRVGEAKEESRKRTKLKQRFHSVDRTHL